MNASKKLVGLGDSIIKGVLFTQEDSGKSHYSLSDNNIVDRVAASMGAEVLNLGKMGCTIEMGERILDRYVDRLGEVEYVLLCFGGNDSDYNWRSIAEVPDAVHEPRTKLKTFETAYERLVNKLKGLGKKPLILSLPPMDAQKYFDFFSAGFNLEQKSNVLNWLKGSVDTIWAGHELYNDAVKRVASLTGTQLIDITTPLGDGRVYLCADGIHPNVYAQETISKIVRKNIVCQ